MSDEGFEQSVEVAEDAIIFELYGENVDRLPSYRVVREGARRTSPPDARRRTGDRSRPQAITSRTRDSRSGACASPRQA